MVILTTTSRSPITEVIANAIVPSGYSGSNISFLGKS